MERFFILKQINFSLINLVPTADKLTIICIMSNRKHIYLYFKLKCGCKIILLCVIPSATNSIVKHIIKKLLTYKKNNKHKYSIEL